MAQYNLTEIVNNNPSLNSIQIWDDYHRFYDIVRHTDGEVYFHFRKTRRKIKSMQEIVDKACEQGIEVRFR